MSASSKLLRSLHSHIDSVRSDAWCKSKMDGRGALKVVVGVWGEGEGGTRAGVHEKSI